MRNCLFGNLGLSYIQFLVMFIGIPYLPQPITKSYNPTPRNWNEQRNGEGNDYSNYQNNYSSFHKPQVNVTKS